MNLLAVDTAGKTAAVAVMAQDRLLYEAQLNNGLTHSETLLPMIDTALRCAGLGMEQLDLLAVTNGPGSFTGLRIGLSVVKGLAQPRQLPCVGVSTLAALAYGCTGEGTVIGALDARRGQVYWAAFDLASHARLTDDAAEPVEKLEKFKKPAKNHFFLLAMAQLCATIGTGRSRVWHPARPHWAFCGAPAWRWPPRPSGNVRARSPLPSCCRTITG